MRRIFSFFLYFRARRMRVGDGLHRLAREIRMHREAQHRGARSSSVTGQGMYCFKPSNACWVCIGFG